MEIGRKYIVAIRCFTFNQSDFIIDALNGFVMQQTDFPFVALVVDDASTDNEPRLLRDYFYNNFDIQDSSVSYQKNAGFGTVFFARHKTNLNCYFAILLLKENHRSQRISKAQYLNPWLENSKYVALCEGDDYWTDPLKLSKQVTVLEQNDGMALCCTGCTVKTNTKEKTQRRYQKECVVPPEDIIKRGGLWLHTVTYLYRRSLLDGYPQYCKSCHVGDFPMILWASLNGGVFFIPDKTAVYRFQSAGSWTSNRESLGIDDLIRGWRSEVDMLKGLNVFSEGKYSGAFKARIQAYLYDAIINHKKDIKAISVEFREEIKLLDWKKKTHVLAIRMHLESVYSFFFIKLRSKIKSVCSCGTGERQTVK